MLSLPPYFAMAQFRSSFAPRVVMGVWWAWVVEGWWMGVCPPRGDGDVGGRSHGRIHVASLRRRRGWFASSKSCLVEVWRRWCLCCVYVVTGDSRIVLRSRVCVKWLLLWCPRRCAVVLVSGSRWDYFGSGGRGRLGGGPGQGGSCDGRCWAGIVVLVVMVECESDCVFERLVLSNGSFLLFRFV